VTADTQSPVSYRLRRIRSRVLPAWRRLYLRQYPITAIVVALILLLAGFFGNWIAPYPADAVNLGIPLAPPFWLEGGTFANVFGTDQLGRDLFSRLILGTKVSLLTAAAAIFLGGSIGVALGLIAGYVGGVVEMIIMRIVDAFLALPFILMALAFVAALGTGLGNIMLVMALTNWARYARLVRSEVVSIKRRDFVTLAHIAGVSAIGVTLRHILPNIMGSVLVLAVLDIGRSIILEASLSFLGLGIQPPDVSWGLILADGRTYMTFAWWLTVLPGLAIVGAVLSFNALGEWLKRKWDPRFDL
jgi:peptide/nickel transport system permease protein